MSFRVSAKASGRGVSFVSINFNGDPDLKADALETIRRSGNVLTPHVVDGEVQGMFGHTYDDAVEAGQAPTSRLVEYLGLLGAEVEYVQSID